MNFVENFNFIGVDAKEIPCIKGNGVPTDSTEAAVGMFYMDESNGDVYKLTHEGWKPVGGEADTELSTESENPVQNKVITAELEAMKADIESLKANEPTYEEVLLSPFVDEAFHSSVELSELLPANIQEVTKYRIVLKSHNFSIEGDDVWDNFLFECVFVPDSGFSGAGNITEIKLLSNEASDISATRGCLYITSDLSDPEYAEAYIEFALQITLVVEGGTSTQNCIFKVQANSYGDFYNEFDIYASVPVTETASTYDMRTQSIDRQLEALIEESRARRNKSSTEET